MRPWSQTSSVQDGHTYWVRDAGEPHAGDVARDGVHALEVPDGLGGLGVELLGEEAAAIGL